MRSSPLRNTGPLRAVAPVERQWGQEDRNRDVRAETPPGDRVIAGMLESENTVQVAVRSASRAAAEARPLVDGRPSRERNRRIVSVAFADSHPTCTR